VGEDKRSVIARCLIEYKESTCSNPIKITEIRKSRVDGLIRSFLEEMTREAPTKPGGRKPDGGHTPPKENKTGSISLERGTNQNKIRKLNKGSSPHFSAKVKSEHGTKKIRDQENNSQPRRYCRESEKQKPPYNHRHFARPPKKL